MTSALKDLRGTGHWPTLLAAFLYFDLSFCVWYLLGPLASFVAEDLGLTATQTGLIVSTPLLGGSRAGSRWAGERRVEARRRAAGAPTQWAAPIFRAR